MDTDLIVRAFLTRQGTSLYALCGERVYVPHLPFSADNAPAFDDSVGALMFRSTGGPVKESIDAMDVQYEFRCFGGKDANGLRTAGLAKSVFIALRDALRNVTMAGTHYGILARAHLESAGQDLVDPDLGWPFVLTSGRMLCLAKPA